MDVTSKEHQLAFELILKDRYFSPELPRLEKVNDKPHLLKRSNRIESEKVVRNKLILQHIKATVLVCSVERNE